VPTVARRRTPSRRAAAAAPDASSPTRAVLVDALAVCQQQRSAALERLEVAEAESAGALADLAAVVAILRRVGGYLDPADQLALGAARARLAMSGGRGPESRATGKPGPETRSSGGGA
jgi:hypothetical protein